MATLFLAIILVYILLFQVKGTTIKSAETTSWGMIQISMKSWSQELTNIDQQREEFTLTTGTSIWTPTTGTATTQTQVSVLTETNNDDSEIPVSTGSNMILLSGTNVFYGSIESIEKLGIKYQYALVDDKNIYYINLGNPTYDFASIARKLGGNLYELKTEQELAQNKLFGTKVIYINLPEYKEKRVLMLLYIRDQVRLIQMDYTLYHKTKAYLKSLFIQ